MLKCWSAKASSFNTQLLKNRRNPIIFMMTFNVEITQAFNKRKYRTLKMLLGDTKRANNLSFILVFWTKIIPFLLLTNFLFLPFETSPTLENRSNRLEESSSTIRYPNEVKTLKMEKSFVLAFFSLYIKADLFS